MSKPAKKFSDKAKQKRHEEHLKKRRAQYREKKTVEMASKAAEGEVDFEALVEAEKQRQEDLRTTHARNAGSKSPKTMSQAREDLATAFELMGGVPALVVWGRSNPTEFYRIWAKLVPTNVKEEQTALPLETLLEKLASKEEKTVMEAAREIGEETMAEAQKRVREEDADLSQLKTQGTA